MPNTIRLQAISNSAGTIAVPIVELQERTIQSFSATHTAGEWNPDNNYNWIPGSFVDFTPRRPDSRITYYYRAPHAWVVSSHAISHWRFFVNGAVWFWHNTSGTHIEDACTFRWDFPSWGTTAGRIGYQMRSYANDNNELRMNTTYYWNGTGRSAQNCFSQIIVEEYVGGPDEPIGSTPTLNSEPFVAR